MWRYTLYIDAEFRQSADRLNVTNTTAAPSSVCAGAQNPAKAAEAQM
jgi:hypothetical protein